MGALDGRRPVRIWYCPIHMIQFNRWLDSVIHAYRFWPRRCVIRQEDL